MLFANQNTDETKTAVFADVFALQFTYLVLYTVYTEQVIKLLIIIFYINY